MEISPMVIILAVALAILAGFIILIRKAKDRLQDPKTTIPHHDIPFQHSIEEKFSQAKGNFAGQNEKAKESVEMFLKSFQWNKRDVSKKYTNKPKIPAAVILGIIGFFFAFGWIMERGIGEDGSGTFSIFGSIIFYLVIAVIVWKFRKKKVKK